MGQTTAINGGTLLERDLELARFEQLLAGAAAGHGAGASIVGPAGIGKTSLLTAARDLARANGVRTLAARGGEVEQDFAFGVVRQLFERPVRELRPADRAGLLEGAASAAAAALGLPREPAADSSPLAVIHGLYWLSANFAEREPLLLIVDDLHWADGASLRFLSYLQRRIEDLPLLVLCAARPPVDTPQPELVEGVTADSGVTRLVPAPLSVRAVGELLGAGAEPAFVEAVHAATAGNPFLCMTVGSALAAEGVEPVAAQIGRVTEVAAQAVSREVVRRMTRASGPAAALARAVAIVGTRAQPRHVAALAGLDEREAAAAADALAAQGLLRVAIDLDFVHPLLRAAVVEQIPPAERALLHRRAWQVLRDAGVAPERLAIHLLAAPPAGDPEVVATLRAAAVTVAALGDPISAARYLRRALDEPPPADTRLAVLHELGVAELHSGEPERAADHLRPAIELATEDAERRRAAARDLSLALRALRRYQESVAVLDAVIAEVSGSDPDRALAMTAELHQTAMMAPETYTLVTGRFDGALDPALEGGPRPQGRHLAALATEACLRSADAQRVRDWARVAVDSHLIEEDDPHSGLWANIAFPLIFAEGYDLAALMCTRATDRARRHGSPTAIARAHLVSAMLALRTGAVREAVADARVAIEVAGEATIHLWPMALGVALEALVELGDLETAERTLRETDTEGALPVEFLYTWTLLGRGALRLAQNRLDQAIADLEEVGRRGHHGWRPWNPAMFTYRSTLAAALLKSGRAADALRLADEELDLAERWGAPRAIGLALRARGLASQSVDDLRAAEATLATSGARLEHARALVELGAAIARTGRLVDARDPLRAGLELAHRCGATALTARAREELIAAGARPRRIMRSGVEALTPSELRVARMAADGMTNRAIAQALFVTLRTVQVHLTHTYQKLSISSRDELPGALASRNGG